MLGDRIKELRTALRLTQSAFGKEVGSFPSSVSEWENGKVAPKEASLIVMELKYHVNPDWLRNGRGNMFLPEAVADLTPEVIHIITWIKSLSPKEQAWLDIEMRDKIKKYNDWLKKQI